MYFDFISFIKNLSDKEDLLFKISGEISKISPADYRSDIVLNKNIAKSYADKFDDLISEVNNDFSSTYLKTTPSSSNKLFSFVPSSPIFVDKLKLYVDDFFYDSNPTNFKITVDYEVGGSKTFYAIPSNYLGSYLELFSLSQIEFVSKFTCKKEFPVKIYDDKLSFIDSKTSFRSDGFFEIPNLSYDKVFVSYTPTYDNYEYLINSSIKAIIVETDVEVTNPVYFSNI